MGAAASQVRAQLGRDSAGRRQDVSGDAESSTEVGRTGGRMERVMVRHGHEE